MVVKSSDWLFRKKVRQKFLYHLKKRLGYQNSDGEASNIYRFFKNIQIKGFPITFFELEVVLRELKLQYPTISSYKLGELSNLVCSCYMGDIVSSCKG